MRLTRLILLLILAAPTLQAQRKLSPALQQRVSRMAPAENHAASPLTIHRVHHAFPALTGKGFTVSVKENTPDSTDIDFRGRWLGTGLESPTLSQQATIMATIIAGGEGKKDFTGRLIVH